MRLGKYAATARPALCLHVRALCLCIEVAASDTCKGEIERQLFALDSNGRQWDRWKSMSNLPSAEEFSAAASAAVTLGWLPEGLGSSLKGSYQLQRSSTVEAGGRSGWDQMKVINACLKFAMDKGSVALVQHCEEWQQWISGPTEGTKEFAEWVKRKEPSWDAENQEHIQSNIHLIVERAMIEIFRLGVSNPSAAIRANLKIVCKEWPAIQASLEEDD